MELVIFGCGVVILTLVVAVIAIGIRLDAAARLDR